MTQSEVNYPPSEKMKESAVPEAQAGTLRQKRNSEAEKQGKIPLMTLEEVRNIPPPEWLIDGAIIQRKLGGMRGRPGAGKSRLGREWAYSVALGRPWLERDSKQGPVVYVHTEGLDEVGGWANTWAKREGVTDAAMNKAPVRFVPFPVGMIKAQNAKDFIAAIKGFTADPALIVIDTRANEFFGGSENEIPDMSSYVENCLKLRWAFPNATVLSMTHPGKNNSKGDMGSAKWAQSLDFGANLTERNTKGQETSRLIIQGPGIRSFEMEKVKGLAPRPPFPLVFGRDGLFSLAFEQTEFVRDPKQKKPPKGTAEILRALMRAGEVGMTWAELRDAVCDGKNGLKESTFSTAFRALKTGAWEGSQDRARIEQVEGRWRLKDAETERPGQPAATKPAYALPGTSTLQ